MLYRAASLPRSRPALCGRSPCVGRYSRSYKSMTGALTPDSSAQGELDSEVEALVRRLHSSGTKTVCYVTGGASQAIAWLLGVPGASNTVLEVSVPYCRDSLVGILGAEPQQYCSQETAVAMARAAYSRAADLAPFGAPICGLAATCALASEPPKRGEHRAYVAAHDGTGTRVAALRFAKGARSRWGEDAVASRVVLKVFAEAAGVDTSAFPLGLINSSSNGVSSSAEAGPPSPTAARRAAGAAAAAAAPAGPSSPPPSPPSAAAAAAQSGQPSGTDDLRQETLPGPSDPLHLLLSGGARCIEFSGGQVFVDAPRGGRVYLPGSFNPLHEGHRRLLESACRAAGRGVEEGCYELSVGNADKGMLPLEEVRLRVSQFVTAGLPVVVTAVPLYVDKAALFPRSTFVVGHDTAARLVLPKYYGDSYIGMALEFATFRAAGCRLLVAGRADPSTGTFLQLSDISVPPELSDLLAPIPEAEFRADISSTALRQKGAGLLAAVPPPPNARPPPGGGSV